MVALCNWLVDVTQPKAKRGDTNSPPDMHAWFGIRYRVWAWAMHRLVRISNAR